MKTRLMGERGTRAGDDSGLSLVELLVATMLSLFLLALIAGLFIRSMQANASVRATTAGTNAARVQFDAIQQAVRLAVETDVRAGATYTVASASGEGDLLIVKTRRNEGVVAAAATWRCMGWYLTPDGTLRALSRPTPTSGVAATAGDPASWPVVAQDVTRLGSAPPFVAHDPDPDVEAWYPGSVTLALRFEPDDGNAPVNVSTTVSPRRQLQLDGEVPGGVKCAAT